MVLRVGSFLPFNVTAYLNGHNFIERELIRRGIPFRKDDNRSYGNVLLSPLIGGSGGAGFDGNPGPPDGGGGGAILIASNTRVTIDGGIHADGGTGATGGGAE
jgi:hypothetical protein